MREMMETFVQFPHSLGNPLTLTDPNFFSHCLLKGNEQKKWIQSLRDFIENKARCYVVEISITLFFSSSSNYFSSSRLFSHLKKMVLSRDSRVSGSRDNGKNL